MHRLAQALNRPAVAIAAVALLAFATRFAHLSFPPDLVFDEVYYAKAGCIYIGGSDHVCGVNSDDEKYWRENEWDVGSWVHPPLGKWQIGLGEKLFGVDPFGRRAASALAGTLVAVFTAGMAQLLFRRPIWTFVAGLLIVADGMEIVMSRLALLDIHLAVWVSAGFLFLLLDRRWIDRRTRDPEPDDPGPAPPDLELDPDPGLGRRVLAPVYSPVWRPWRFAAGAALGAAAAVKWSGAYAIPAVVILSYAWETTRRRRGGEVSVGTAFGRAFVRETFGLVLAFVLVPILVYLATWLPWLNHFDWSWSELWHQHGAMWDYHMHDLKETALNSKTGAYTPTHPYYSRAWQWLLMIRPVNMYSPDFGDSIRQILAVGNVAVYWASIPAILFALWRWPAGRDWRAGFVTVAVVMQYLPWLLVARPQFSFYVLPFAPFLVLAIVYMLRAASEARIVQRRDGAIVAESTLHPYRPFVIGYVVLAVVLAVWFWPVWTGGLISDDRWRLIVWFRRWS